MKTSTYVFRITSLIEVTTYGNKDDAEDDIRELMDDRVNVKFIDAKLTFTEENL